MISGLASGYSVPVTEVVDSLDFEASCLRGPFPSVDLQEVIPCERFEVEVDDNVAISRLA
jgi:hypothetical protein